MTNKEWKEEMPGSILYRDRLGNLQMSVPDVDQCEGVIDGGNRIGVPCIMYSEGPEFKLFTLQVHVETEKTLDFRPGMVVRLKYPEEHLDSYIRLLQVAISGKVTRLEAVQFIPDTFKIRQVA